MPIRRHSAADSVVTAFQKISRTRLSRETNLEKAIKRLAKKWRLTSKQKYFLQKKLSRIPAHLGYLKRVQLEIVAQYPRLTAEQFWRAYSQDNINRGQFSFPNSGKIDVSGKFLSKGLERRGRPFHPAAPLAGYVIRKIAEITRQRARYSRATDDSSHRSRPPYGPAINVIRRALELNLFAIPVPSNETIVQWIRETRKTSLRIPPDYPFGKAQMIWGAN